MAGLKLKKGDKVEVISGKDKGKRGKVLVAQPKKDRLIVEGVNMVKRHTRASQKNPQGGIAQREGPVRLSNVMLVCPSCGERTRVGFLAEKDGHKVRICRKCEKSIDK